MIRWLQKHHKSGAAGSLCRRTAGPGPAQEEFVEIDLTNILGAGVEAVLYSVYFARALVEQKQQRGVGRNRKYQEEHFQQALVKSTGKGSFNQAPESF